MIFHMATIAHAPLQWSVKHKYSNWDVACEWKFSCVQCQLLCIYELWTCE
jgi:hypothetical protein